MLDEPAGVSMRVRRTLGWLILSSLVAIVGSAASFPFWHYWQMSLFGCRHDRLKSWKSFHARHFNIAYALPIDAKVVSATERHQSGTEDFEIRFHLPGGAIPERRLRQIVRDSGATLDDCEYALPLEYHLKVGGILRQSRLAYEPASATYSILVSKSVIESRHSH